MKKNVLLILALLFIANGYAQISDIKNKVWKLKRVTEIFQHDANFHTPPSNSEVENIYFTITESNNTYYFETSVCDHLSGELSFSNGITLETATINSSICNLPKNNSFNDFYIQIFYKNGTIVSEPFDYNYSVNASGIESFSLYQTSYFIQFELSHLSAKQPNETKFQLYPNPAKETVFIENNHQKINQIQVIDISGKQLKTLKNVKNKVDISELTSGVYFFKIYCDGNTTIKKVIKE